jgi:hypothetical protein
LLSKHLDHFIQRKAGCIGMRFKLCYIDNLPDY